MKDCGSCRFFFKWPNDKYGGGLCDYLDARTKSDNGHKCMFHKRKKYVRNKNVVEQGYE